MEKSILELEQEAARLQMNPHFIFNCLNSIQGFISQMIRLKQKISSQVRQAHAPDSRKCARRIHPA